MPISNPPEGLTEAQIGDIFFYWTKSLGKSQMWIRERIGLIVTWTGVCEGHKVLGVDGVERVLVVTEGGQPSLVQGATWEKQYRRRMVRMHCNVEGEAGLPTRLCIA